MLTCLQVIWELFKLCPTPEAAVAAATKDISAIIDTLGFYKRAAAFQRFSRDYIEKQVLGCPIKQCPGCHHTSIPRNRMAWAKRILHRFG